MWYEWGTLLSASLLSCGALVVGWRRRRGVDGLYFAATLPFVGLAGLDLLGSRGMVGGALLVITTRLAYQLIVLGVTAFLMALLKGGRPVHRGLLVVQTIGGLVLAVWQPFGGLGWETLNIACSTLFVLLLAHGLWRHGATRGWTVLLVGIAALGAMLTDLRSANGQAIGVSWTQLVFTAILFVLWLMLTRPVASAGRAPRHSSGMAPQERQQLAQELHDGVGSQLTTIISALDHGSPQERATAAALQEALIDLKLLVDGVDEEASVVSLLANLRYRTRPLLEAAGIELGWHVADEALLEQVQGPPAREILRIAQESLANVVHHSGGDAVTVTLCHMKAQDALWLEIADNGRGIGPSPDVEPEDAAPAAWPPGRPGGKGLPGMRRRAQQLGGQLDVHSVPGEGTRVTLQVPLERLVAETEA